MNKMTLKKPSSTQECIYFTNRLIGDCNVVAWVLRKKCPKCSNGTMGKPLKKGGKIDKKADHYVCYSCGYSEGEEELENSLMLNIEYKCPNCASEGETTCEYKRKTFDGVPSYVFECQKCKKNIGITKKMKEPKKKGKE